uniref:Uncharacterized protein n=1 Tax=Leishmania guyanensis TaxID=5670 RepID=A0A1E1J222_LEIGU|nr:Hypothetical protein BN36_3051130 [Leishmania guyanensis]
MVACTQQAPPPGSPLSLPPSPGVRHHAAWSTKSQLILPLKLSCSRFSRFAFPLLYATPDFSRWLRAWVSVISRDVLYLIFAKQERHRGSATALPTPKAA